MNILIYATHYPVASGRYAADALRRMGHDIRTDGPVPGWGGREIWGGVVDEKYIWTPQPAEEGWKPDLVIIMDAHLPADVAEGHDCPVVVYGVDNHVRDYAQYNVEHLFLAHGSGRRIGEDSVTWLPCGYDPDVFGPGKEWRWRGNDAALIGVLYSARSELLYALQASRLGWRIQYGMGPIYDEYAAIYQDARVSLVRSASGDVAQRVWETAAMGCLVLMDAAHDCEALGLVDGENCLIYQSHDEAVEKSLWISEHMDEAEAIAAAGQAWAQSGTWDVRLQVILDWLEAQNKPKRTTRRKATK